MGPPMMHVHVRWSVRSEEMDASLLDMNFSTLAPWYTLIQNDSTAPDTILRHAW